MPRIARVVVPGMAHHVTQRGNRRADVFFTEGDPRRYLVLLRDYARQYGLEIWAYCLMTNHVHFVAVPQAADSLGRRRDDLLSPVQMPWPVPDWADYLRTEDERMTQSLRRQTMTGRPSGSGDFIARLEGLLGRVLQPRKPGPKAKR